MCCLFQSLIHPDFDEVFSKMSCVDKLGFLLVHSFDRLKIWHKLPVFFGLIYLQTRRTLHEKYNLLAVGESKEIPFDPENYPYRTGNGEYNDPENKEAGNESTFFGRNMPPKELKAELMRPDPMVVATKLLARRSYKDTGKQFNMIAAAWIQFMVHDWIDHLEETQHVEERKKTKS